MTTRFAIRQQFDVGIDECLDFMCDPGLHRHLTQIDGLSHRRVTGVRQRGRTRYWQLEVGLAEALPATFRERIDVSSLQWVQKFEIDMESLEFRFVVEHPFPVTWLRAGGSGVLRADGPDASALEIEVEVSSAFPLFGRRVEAAIAERSRKMMANDHELRRRYMSDHRGHAQPYRLDENGEMSRENETPTQSLASGSMDKVTEERTVPAHLRAAGGEP